MTISLCSDTHIYIQLNPHIARTNSTTFSSSLIRLLICVLSFLWFVFVGIYHWEPFNSFCLDVLIGKNINQATTKKSWNCLDILPNWFNWILLFLERFWLTNLLLTLFFYMFRLVVWSENKNYTWTWMLNWSKKVCHNLISMDRRTWEPPPPHRIPQHRPDWQCKFQPQRNWATQLRWPLPRASFTNIRWVSLLETFFGFSWIFFYFFDFDFSLVTNPKKSPRKKLNCGRPRVFRIQLMSTCLPSCVITECFSCDCRTFPGTIQRIWSLSVCCYRWDLQSIKHT